MRNLRDPKWIFLVNTIPTAALLLLTYGEYRLIESVLNEENKTLWRTFGVLLTTTGLLHFGYALYLSLNQRLLPIYYGFLALLIYVPLLYTYSYYMDELVSFAVPQWMTSGNVIWYAGTFLMPTLAYALFTLVVGFTPATRNHRVWKSLVFSLLVPVSGYVFFLLIQPLWKGVDGTFYWHAIVVWVIIVTLLFLFFVVRMILILVRKKGPLWKRYELLWKIPVTIGLPLLGLQVNHGLFFGDWHLDGSGIFGNFSNSWFLVLAIVNGTLLCLPTLDHWTYRLFLFLARSITLSFSFYFFLVFLPLLPLSVVALLAFGAGLLLLTPLVVFVIHVSELSRDFNYLKDRIPRYGLILAISLGFLMIPGVITFNYAQERQTLHEALDYLDRPDYDRSYRIDRASLHHTLDVLQEHKKRNRDTFFGNKVPYLTAYFNWLVLDNLTLSETKIYRMERVFFGKTSSQPSWINERKDPVHITGLNTRSTYDPQQNAWRSWVDLELTNASEHAWPAEYQTSFELPTGCYISDYYLYVGDRKEMGWLAEKKSALWVYNNIRRRNRDPGLLYYLSGNRLAFRVFPFAQDEVRKTGFEVLHREPVVFTLDGQRVVLGDTSRTYPADLETERIAYVSAYTKQQLKRVQRKPYFHFLVDVSDPSTSDRLELRIEQALTEHPTLAAEARISFVNTYVSDPYSIDHQWKQRLRTQSREGGFYLERGLETVLREAYCHPTDAYPVLVVVTDRLPTAILDRDLADWQFAFPESDLFYHLEADGALAPHRLTTNPLRTLSDRMPPTARHTVREYPMQDGTLTYLPDDNLPSIVIKAVPTELPETAVREKDWSTALTLQGLWASQILHPETSDHGWLDLVAHSFRSGIMTPTTSYLVVENEAQKAVLKKKQEQVLSGNPSLDPGEELQNMSEPAWFVPALLLGLFLIYRHRQRMPWNLRQR